jgi:5-methylcytosine-specific restriction endonuclease McrA
MKICPVEGCHKAIHTANFCTSHYDKQRYLLNRDKLLVQSKAYAEANKDFVKAYQKEWRSNNKKRIYENSKRNYSARKEHYDNYRAEWRKKNKLKWNGYRSTRRIREKENGIFLITAKEYRKLERDSCFYCGSYEQPTIDHVVPIVRGGKHSIGNIVVACKSCNSQKSKKTIMEWRKLHCA